MANKLGMVAVVGLTISLVSFAAVAAVLSRELGDKGFNFSDMNWSNKPRCVVERSASVETRDIAWEGGDHAIVKLMAKVNYRPGTNDKLQITGHPGVLNHIRFRDGALELDCSMRNSINALTVTLPGRAFRSISLSGAGKLHLSKLKQDNLAIFLPGASEVEADGEVGNLKVALMGAGEAKLGDLSVRDLDLSITGAGEAEVAPTGDADITIIGAGSVRLKTEPKSLKTNIIGAGDIKHAAR